MITFIMNFRAFRRGDNMVTLYKDLEYLGKVTSKAEGIMSDEDEDIAIELIKENLLKEYGKLNAVINFETKHGIETISITHECGCDKQ